MKTCPVCKSVSFDDAEVCYGCLHRFEQGDESAEGQNAKRFGVSVAPAEAIERASREGITPQCATTDEAMSCAISSTSAWDFSIGPSLDGSAIQITVRPRINLDERATFDVA